MKQSLLKHCLFSIVFVFTVSLSQAQVSITATSLTYTQNFDGIDQSLLNLPDGWLFSSTGAYALRRASSSASLTSSTVGGSFLFVVGGTDEAIGILNGTANNDLPNGQTISFTFTNNTGKYITALSIGLNYEKYRNAPRAWTWRVTSTGTSGTISALSLAYGADGNSDNNFPPLQTPVSGNITGLAIADGSSYTITWTLTGASGTGNGQALGIDDFTMTATAQTLTTSSTDYFRSKQDGNWGSTSSWQSSSNGINTWINATQTPGATSAGTSIQGGNTITVASNVTGSLVSVSGGATLAVNSGVNLTINNGPGTDLDIFGTVNNSGTITPTNASIIVESGGGALNCLSTNSTSTGAIGNIGSGSITGSVTVQRYLTAQRGYRVLGHPFNSNMALSNLQPYIDITGSGSGLTAGNASAFNYTTGVWSAYTANSQTWNRNEALLLFVRGTPGQGIGTTNGSYTPSAPTISLTGTVNTGSMNYTVKAASTFGGAAQGWNAIGNPYPAPIDVNSISGISQPGGTGASIYVWNATMGATGAGIASGGYDFRTLGSSIVIPAYGAFFIKNTSGLDQVINFTESNKNTSSAPLALLRTTGSNEGFDLVIADNNTYWDKLRIAFNKDAATASTDKTDLDKLSNVNLDFYSLGSDKVRLAVNTLPALQSENDIIPLGLSTNQQRVFTVKADNVNLASLNGTLFLHDKYAGQLIKVDAGMVYGFEVTADAGTKGEDRFELVFAKKTTTTLVDNAIGGFTAKVLGNVIADDQPLRVQVQNATTNAVIQVKDLSGKTISTQHAVNGTNTISIGKAAAGMYIVQTTDGNCTVTEKLVKQ